MHSMQAGYLEKAQKYTDKALMQLEKLKSELVTTGSFCFFKNTIIVNECIMWVYGFCNCKKGGKIEDFYYLARLSRLCQNPGVLFLINAMFQCWTAAPSSLLSKSFYWSISSCVDSSQATRPLHYKRYTVSACRGHFLNVNVFNSGESSTL